MASFKRYNSKLKTSNNESSMFNKSSTDSLVEKFNTKYVKASSGYRPISKSKECKKYDGKSSNKIEKLNLISVSLLSDFKTKLSECQEILTKFGRVVVEAEGSSIPIAINLGLQIKNKYTLPVFISLSTGSKYMAVAPDSPIREYQNVPSITLTLTQTVLEENIDAKLGEL